ncbi:hypothetical protein [Actinorugispora endophytica]|uniref:Uncharacterized protein n=1 Tax=Actinorugispora endophytica TaxID=1605990 RepID=A0A4R6V8Q0_9ACTN|nr:hypothetical protein [Actinorugispora endophytica]TDQ55546.1 hypothetical protein EV190_101878 [Actinorugispora endophytica]
MPRAAPDPNSDLIADKWILSVSKEGEFVAFRPFGWTGPEPHERVTAETRDALLAKLRYRSPRESGLQ